MTTGDSWAEHKAEHLALSAAAADRYDDVYEKANFATGSYMRYEMETISRLTRLAPSQSLALDLGCGTGRDSFLLARDFSQVYAYDFSPEMIRVANANKIRQRAGNVLFDVLDVERDPLPIVSDSVAFINSAFGMGSFVGNLEQLFREVRRALQPGGVALFSFYNATALVNQLQLEWRPALAARVVPGVDVLEVDFEGRLFRIAAKAYQPGDVKRKVEGNFKLLEMTTFPTLSALFPQSLFENESARELCTSVDKLLAANLETAAGPYIVVACQKGGKPPTEKRVVGYERVLQLLAFHGIPQDIREHGPVRTMADVKEVLDVPPSQMVKSILIAAVQKEETDPEDLSAELFLIAIPADRSINMGKVASVLGRPRKRLRFANQREVEALTGFRVGSIPPFGLPRNVPVILDHRLEQHEVVWCGTGKATESLRITKQHLKRLSAYTVADVSKPEDGQ